MRRWLLGAAAGLSLAVATTADDPPKKDDPPPKKDYAKKEDAAKTPLEQVQAIKKELVAAESEFYTTLQDLDDEKKEDVEKSQKLYKEFTKKQEAAFAKALEIAKADPKSDAGFAALEWLLTTPRAYYVAVGKPAMELAAEHHAANPKMAPVVRMLGRLTPHESTDSYGAAVALLKAVRDKNPNRIAQGYAAMGLIGLSLRKVAVAERNKSPDAERLAAEDEKELEAFVKDYGGAGGTDDVGAWAKGELFELRNLRVGKVAPDIEGEDLDGVKFKHSDYRGKVVVIDFWGDW
jgi:hypothetical protein